MTDKELLAMCTRCENSDDSLIRTLATELKRRLTETSEREKALLIFAKRANAFLETVVPYMGAPRTANQALATEIYEQGKEALAAYVGEKEHREVA